METDNDKTEVESSDDEKHSVQPRKSGHKRTSISWQFFDRDNAEFATCKTCKKSISYRSGLSNLMKHIKRTHFDHFQKLHGEQPGQVDEEINYLDYVEKVAKLKQNEDDETNSNDVSYKHSIWRYFTLLDKSLNLASCIFCKKHINCTSQGDLLHHLKKKHNNDFIPNKKVRVLVTDSNELYEIEEVTQAQHEAVDDDDHIDHLQIQPKNEIFNDEPPKKRKLLPTAPEDHIDLFAKYVSSLLRKLPTRVSNKLQADFISKIMEVSVTDETEQIQIPVTGDCDQ